MIGRLWRDLDLEGVICCKFAPGKFVHNWLHLFTFGGGGEGGGEGGGVGGGGGGGGGGAKK